MFLPVFQLFTNNNVCYACLDTLILLREANILIIEEETHGEANSD
jgi:hypothetical protein